jgi:4'-phosphopantetheinyl transferase
MVEVLFATLTGAPPAEDWELLSPDERTTATRFHHPADHQAYVAAHALVRRALSRWADVIPSDWQFARTRQGRPELAAPIVGPAPGRRLRFNLSHTRRLVACAVMLDNDVGIDVEDAECAAPLEVAQTNFALEERVTLDALPISERSRRFFEYWTLKEAYLKARGLGLTLPLDELAFRLSGPKPTISFGPRLRDDPRRWRFESWGYHGHLVGLAVRTPLALDVRVIDGMAADLTRK